MNTLLEPDDMGENVKAWLKKNGIGLMVGIVLAIALTFGYQFWVKQQARTAIAASMLYDEYQKALMMDEQDVLKATVSQLRDIYPESVYTTGVILLEASRASFEKRYEDAERDLEWVRQRGQAFIQPLAVLRLASLKMATQSYDDALTLLDNFPLPPDSPEASYRPAFEELRGDIALAKGEKQKAALHYEEAAKGYTAEDFNHVLLQMKLETYAAANMSELEQGLSQ